MTSHAGLWSLLDPGSNLGILRHQSLDGCQLGEGRHVELLAVQRETFKQLDSDVQSYVTPHHLNVENLDSFRTAKVPVLVVNRYVDLGNIRKLCRELGLTFLPAMNPVGVARSSSFFSSGGSISSTHFCLVAFCDVENA